MLLLKIDGSFTSALTGAANPRHAANTKPKPRMRIISCFS
jgi:hypothetical protein